MSVTPPRFQYASAIASLVTAFQLACVEPGAPASDSAVPRALDDAASLPHSADAASSGYFPTCLERRRQPCDRPGYCRVGGRPIDYERRCIGDPVPLGCANYDECGNDSIVIALDRNGVPWYFGNDCYPADLTPTNDPFYALPSDYTHCNPPPAELIRCSEYATNACPTVGCAEIRAIRYDPNKRCRWPGVAVIGCRAIEERCEAKITHAAPLLSEGGPLETDEHYEVADSCLPTKFAPIPRSPKQSVATWALCSD